MLGDKQMSKLKVRCLYCKGPAEVVEVKDKMILECPVCGKKELTTQGLDKVRRNEK